MIEKTLLITKNISKKYKSSAVLNGVNMSVKKGAIYGLIGKNGAGKTTLLRTITGQIPCYNGCVHKGGKSIKMSCVINTPALYLNMSAFQNLKLHAMLLDNCDAIRIEKALRLVGLENTGNKKVRDFSLGMTQRLKLAQALIESPDILILDEPINGLDPSGISDLRNLIIKLNKELNMTFIISSHILSELENTATDIGILANGKIVLEATKEQIEKSNKTLEEIYMSHTTKGGIH